MIRAPLTREDDERDLEALRLLDAGASSLAAGAATGACPVRLRNIRREIRADEARP